MLGTVLGVLYLSHLGLTSLLRVSKPGLREAGTHGRPPAGQAQLRLSLSVWPQPGGLTCLSKCTVCVCLCPV